ncbi:MAG TPA: GGDEF domain-containing response regulator [Oxalobacteraceae bacterium]|nr:GGDEF domain-containing response regulator [Oxalobacteraceae bacterium]
MYNKPLQVLFVEDSEDDKELLLNALDGEFAGIVHARVDSPAALRAALTSQDWDVIISDHGLPQMDAAEALRIVQACGCEAPFIVVSGSMPEDVMVSVMTAGAADMIRKRNLSRLVPAVKRELKKSVEVSGLRKAQAYLRHIACYDQQTGLPNRELLAQKLAQLNDASGQSAKGALMVVSINRFSLIRRTLGIEAAEEVLRQTAERLRKIVGDDGLAGSLGSDRFAVLLTAPGAAGDPAAVAERVTEAATLPLMVAGQELFLAPRIGIAIYPQDGQDFHKLAVNAEIAMSQVEIGGRRSHGFFASGMSAAGEGRLALEQALYRALQQNEFVLHYQPQIDVRSGRVVGFEALLRWEQPDGTCVPPVSFIPLLEETGLIVSVGEWVLRTACAQNLAWQDAGYPPLRMAVNLSAVQFRQAELVPMVRRVLAETGLEPRYLELEITENVAMHNEEMVIETLSELRAMGVSLAIDDFGTGYSSLSYLQRFPVHKLKIDRSFVIGITEAAPDSPIVRTIVSLARNLGLDMIAEGVETQHQLDFLLSCGCAEMQGYLFSRPAPAEEIQELLDGVRHGVH